MTNKRSNIPWCYTKSNGCVDKIREESDTIFEVVVGDLHDTTAKLDDGNTRTLLHLRSSVQQAVFENTSIWIDDENIITDPNMTISPCSVILFQNSFEAPFICNTLIDLSPVCGSINLLQRFLNGIWDCESIVHIGHFLESSYSDHSMAAFSSWVAVVDLNQTNLSNSASILLARWSKWVGSSSQTMRRWMLHIDGSGLDTNHRMWGESEFSVY
jgi:hypothetical protein